MKTPCITFENVTKTFDMRLLYKNINFELQASNVVLLTGNNGTGKSTLLRMAASLCRPTHGEITCHVAQKDCAYLGHSTFIYPQLTAYENLKFWTSAMGKEARTQESAILSVLKQVNLEKFTHDPAGIFSRGMAQRLNIARIILQSPRFLLLDEPCTGLDKDSKQIFYTCIQAFTKKDACILWVSHDPEADSVYATHRMHIENQRVVMTTLQTQHTSEKLVCDDLENNELTSKELVTEELVTKAPTSKELI